MKKIKLLVIGLILGAAGIAYAGTSNCCQTDAKCCKSGSSCCAHMASR